jgi:hypothetical protein
MWFSFGLPYIDVHDSALLEVTCEGSLITDFAWSVLKRHT